MAKINKGFSNLTKNYLFAEMSKRVREFTEENPDKKVIRLGIGDVTLPLPQIAIDAMKKAADEQSSSNTFRGYGPEQGYDFAIDAVQNYYKSFGVNVDSKEIFICEGAKSDVGNIADIFALDNTVLIPDPVYPVYVDSNIMAGRTIKYMDSNAENNFSPAPPDYAVDLVYLCSPNNPTGAAYNREQLKEWVDYANKNNAILLYDAAYESFIEDDNLPRSIFEIDGAKTCAIEFCSLSKTAGFTGTRCGYTVVPMDLIVENTSVRDLWLRRQTTKFNGVPYVIQRAAEAVLSPEGIEQCKKNIQYYKQNAKLLGQAMDDMGISYIGGINSPYIWLKCPKNMGSWEFFDYLLKNCAVVGTPGEGFGKNGAGYFRLSAFGRNEDVVEAIERMKSKLM